MATLKINESTLVTKCLPLANKAQAYYWCSERKGFGVVVGRTGRKTFVVRGYVGGKLTGRTAIGVAGQPGPSGHPWNVKLAIREYEKIRGAMADGKAPVPRREQHKLGGPTLREALEFHIGKMERGENRRGKVCSPRSIATLRGAVELHLKEWLDKPMLALTADVLDEVRRGIEADAERVEGSNPNNPPGRAVANRLLANVSAIWRSWHKRYGLPVACPVERLTPGALAARDNRIDNDELEEWHAKVMAMSNPVRRDLQLVALFTGVRTEGVRTLRWEDIDEEDGLIYIARAKGDRPYTVPLTKTVREVLERRRRENPAYVRDELLSGDGDQGWVFPSLSRDRRTVQAIAEPKERAVVRDAKGRAKRDEDGNYIRETYLPGIQACRRTYNSVAIEIGIPREARETLMNHEGRGVNVKHYGRPQNWDYLRECAEQIETALRARIRGEVKRNGKRKAA